jgi:hypothetical protein
MVPVEAISKTIKYFGGKKKNANGTIFDESPMNVDFGEDLCIMLIYKVGRTTI